MDGQDIKEGIRKNNNESDIEFILLNESYKLALKDVYNFFHLEHFLDFVISCIQIVEGIYGKIIISMKSKNTTHISVVVL